LGKPSDADEVITIKNGRGARVNLNNGKIYEFELGQYNTGSRRQIGYAMYK